MTEEQEQLLRELNRNVLQLIELMEKNKSRTPTLPSNFVPEGPKITRAIGKALDDSHIMPPIQDEYVIAEKAHKPTEVIGEKPTK